MANWQEIPIKNKIFQNVAESALGGGLNATLENGYINDVGGISRFPRLKEYCSLSGGSPTFLEEHRGDLVAVSGSQVYRINPDTPEVENVTEVAVSGSSRVIFAKTENELLAAAGRSIVKLSGDKSELLSTEAPESTHVAYLGARVLAIEPRTGLFQYTPVGNYVAWDPLDTLSAEGKPDNITGMLVTKFGELILAGPDSIEQFDESPSGTRPYFKRWGLGTGLLCPYTLLSSDNRLWGVDQERSWVAFSAQVSNIDSEDIQNTLSSIDNIKDAFAVECFVQGQRFHILQFPFATNVYGTTGVTLLYDFIKQRWSSLYGWDVTKALPTRWDGYSVKQIGTKIFVGGTGKVYTLESYDGDQPQRMLWRSGHWSRPGNQPFRIEGLSLRVNRGERAMNASIPQLQIRANKDNQGFGKWARASMSAPGKQYMTMNFPAMGTCDSVQFEIAVTDNGKIDITRLDMNVTNLRR